MWAAVVTQLVEQMTQISEIFSSNLQQILLPYDWICKMKIKKKETGNCPV